MLVSIKREKTVKVFILMLAFFLFCGIAPVFSQAPLGMPTPLQIILNALPAIPIAGNNLKFQFGGDRWTATVNGENFSAGTIEVEDTGNGCILTLKQTHIWPGAVGRTAGRVANLIPGGAAVGGVLNAAGSIAGAVGAIEASGTEIVLEYKEGPPASFRLVSTSVSAGQSQRAQSDSGDWNLLYYGPAIGMGNYYNYSNAETEWTNSLIMGFIMDVNIFTWFSVTTGFNMGYGVYFPLMLRFGYKLGSFEFSADAGLNFGISSVNFIGLAYGGTLGLAVGDKKEVVFNLGASYVSNDTMFVGKNEMGDMLMVNVGIKFSVGN